MRVVVFIDAGEGEVLEKPEEVEVVCIDWERISNDMNIDDVTYHKLNELLDTDLDKAIEMYRALTTGPEDDGYDEDPRVVGYPH